MKDNRIGTVLVFKRSVTKEEAATALETIRALLDVPDTTYDYVRIKGTASVKSVKRPFRMVDVINGFDDAYGGPVWYTP